MAPPLLGTISPPHKRQKLQADQSNQPTKSSRPQDLTSADDIEQIAGKSKARAEPIVISSSSPLLQGAGTKTTQSGAVLPNESTPLEQVAGKAKKKSTSGFPSSPPLPSHSNQAQHGTVRVVQDHGCSPPALEQVAGKWRKMPAPEFASSPPVPFRTNEAPSEAGHTMSGREPTTSPAHATSIRARSASRLRSDSDTSWNGFPPSEVPESELGVHREPEELPSAQDANAGATTTRAGSSNNSNEDIEAWQDLHSTI